MPSTRLISQAHHNFKRNEIKWIPWKYRISVNKADDISSGRSSKVPKLEGLELHSLLMDDPPAMEISNTSMGLNAVRSLMDIHNTALSLVGAAHLATLRAYSIKSLSLLSAKLEPETGLRTPTILEAQSADKHLWAVVSDLVQEKSWSLDQALHEITYVRSEMSTWLQARPRLPKPVVPVKGGKGDRIPYQPWEPSGKFGTKGKSPKGGKGKGGTKWIPEAFIDGNAINFACGIKQISALLLIASIFMHVRCPLQKEWHVVRNTQRCSAETHHTDSIHQRHLQDHHPKGVFNCMRVQIQMFHRNSRYHNHFSLLHRRRLL